MRDSDADILSRLQVLCVRREYCEREMYQKALRRLQGDETAARRLLASLVSDGFVSDARYAAAFAWEKSALSGWGPAKIRYVLRAKGITDELIASALSEIDTQRAAVRMRRLLDAKWRSLQADPQARQKLLRYALGRGYSYEDVRDLIASLPQEAE